MKIFIALSIISLVSAIPRPELQTNSENEDHGPVPAGELNNSQEAAIPIPAEELNNSQEAALPIPAEELDNGEEAPTPMPAEELENNQDPPIPIPAENDDIEEINLEDLINVIDIIKAILNQISVDPENDKVDMKGPFEENLDSPAHVEEDENIPTKKQNNSNAINIIKDILLEKYRDDQDDKDIIEVVSETNIGAQDYVEDEEGNSIDQQIEYRPINESEHIDNLSNNRPKHLDNLPNNGSNIDTIKVNGVINKGNERVLDNEITNSIPNESNQPNLPDPVVYDTIVSNSIHSGPIDNTSENKDHIEKNYAMPHDRVKLRNIKPWLVKEDHLLSRPPHRVPNLLR